MAQSDFFRDIYSGFQIQKSDEERVLTPEDVIAVIDGRMSKVSELMEAEDYNIALEHLLEIYSFLRERWNYPKIDEEWDTDDLWIRLACICFRICYCYCEQKDYVRAYYYIDMVRSIDSDCFMVWINVLVSSRRVDALLIVESYLNDSEWIREIFSDEDEQKKIMVFLEQRQAYLYIEKGKYSEARGLLEKLLSNPDSSDFAREELDYLDGLDNQTK